MFRLPSNTLPLTNLSARPLPKAVSSIGLWHHLLTFEAWSGVLINCLLVSVSSNHLDYVTCWCARLDGTQPEAKAGG